MRAIVFYAALLVFFTGIHQVSNAQGVLGKVKEKVKEKMGTQSGSSTPQPTGGTDNTTANTQPDNTQATPVSNNETAAPTLKVYQNYDFVPGDKILFEDNFIGDQDGEFPSHWELVKGQATLNKIGGEPALMITDGNYGMVKPRMKTEKYLSDPFTVEYDYYNKDNAYGLITFLNKIDPACNCENAASVQTTTADAIFEGAVSFSKTYADDLREDNFINKWHHVAIAVKNHQLKLYIDQNRVLVVPDTKSDFYSLAFGGIGEEAKPLIFKNVRVASGGGMNMLGKKFTDAKIVTHGINFDLDKATLKPESMGTLNMIVQIMKENPDVKFEIDGHTDNSGSAQHNLALSQQRADAVKMQLVSMGVDASRLSTKGFGDSKPVGDNSTLEGKANNRRVEFVKM